MIRKIQRQAVKNRRLERSKPAQSALGALWQVLTGQRTLTGESLRGIFFRNRRINLDDGVSTRRKK